MQGGPERPSERPNEGKLSFATHLAGNVQAVLRRKDAGRRSLSKVLRFMKEKAQLDIQYANGLKRLISKADFSSLDDSSSSFLLAFEGLTQTIAVSHEIFASQILEGINAPLEKMHMDHETQHKKIEAAIKRYDSLLKVSEESHEAAKQIAEKSCHAHGNVWAKYQEAQYKGDQKGEMFSTYASRVVSSRKKCVSADMKYVESVKRLRRLRTRHREDLSSMLGTCETLESQRMTLLNSSMTKYMTHLQSVLQSQEKTCSSLVKILAEVRYIIAANLVQIEIQKIFIDTL